MLSSIAGAIFGGLGKKFIPKLTGGFFGADTGAKIGQAVGSGLPTLFGMGGGAAAGKQHRKFLGAAFPNANEHMRMGASGGAGGAATGAMITARSAQKMQREELAARERIAKRQSDAQVISSAVPHGVEGISAAKAALRDLPTRGFDTMIKQAREMQPTVLKNLSAQTKNSLASATLMAAKGLNEGHREAYEKARNRVATLLAIRDAFQGDGWALNAVRMDKWAEQTEKGGQPPSAIARHLRKNIEALDKKVCVSRTK